MSKKFLIGVGSMLLLPSLVCVGQNIQLPNPTTENKVSLVESLRQRHSSRSFSERSIPDSTLSLILWSACGINRPQSGRITAPSAINAQDIVVYVIRQDGAFRYEPADNQLVRLTNKDLRKLVAGPQKFAAKAPVSLLLGSDSRKFGSHQNGALRMGLIDAGYVSENICLICSALGLNTVPRMTMDVDGLKKALNLDDGIELILNSQIGYAE